jgi:hypothetical protein
MKPQTAVVGGGLGCQHQIFDAVSDALTLTIHPTLAILDAIGSRQKQMPVSIANAAIVTRLAESFV